MSRSWFRQFLMLAEAEMVLASASICPLSPYRNDVHHHVGLVQSELAQEALHPLTG
jgi:hypothetical protein